MPARERITGLSKRDIAFLERAIMLAQLSDCRQKHGAIIVASGRIIGSGVNTMRNAPVTDLPGGQYSQHAEIAAMRSIKRFRQVGKINSPGNGDLGGARIYVARISRGGAVGLSRPCDNCYSALVKANIKDIIYT